MKLLGKMFALVSDKFKDKIDKQGKPYILHCIHVMQNCGLDDEDSLCIALGHDLIEDTDIDYIYLRREFNETIAEGINCLTLKMGHYDDYIKTIPLYPNVGKKCVAIKLADLEHNSQVSRLKGLTKKDFDRLEKYHRSYTYLKSI